MRTNASRLQIEMRLQVVGCEWGTWVSLIQGKNKERCRARTYSEVNHPESNRLRGTCEGDLQQLGVYRRFVTRDYDRDDRREVESIPFEKGSFARARACSEVHASRLFTPHVVRFDERKRRRSDLQPAVCPVRGRVAESLFLAAMSASGRRLLRY